MKQLRVLLCLFLLCSILDVKIQASYYGFFCYADKNNDGKLTMGIKGEPNEWDGVSPALHTKDSLCRCSSKTRDHGRS